MKKRLLIIIFAGILSFGGCRSSSDQFLSFEDTTLMTGHSADNRLTQSNFFAEDLIIIPELESIGEDSELTAGAVLLADITKGNVIYSDHIYEKSYPASLTKLFTALVVLRYGELTDTVTIGYNATHITENGAKICGFQEGDVISMEALLHSLLIYSGNDAAIAIAEHISGSEESFVEKMNVEAIRIGAVHSNFTNSSGLHNDNQYTTAYDMYLVFNELLKYDTFRSIINSSSYKAVYQSFDGKVKEKTFSSTNSYLTGKISSPEGIEVIGGKTGTTSKAGNCIIMLSRGSSDSEYISVILKAAGSDQLYSQMSHLLSYAIVK